MCGEGVTQPERVGARLESAHGMDGSGPGNRTQGRLIPLIHGTAPPRSRATHPARLVGRRVKEKQKTRVAAGFLVAGEGFEPSTSGL
jgi:hypothetical protein